MVKSFYPVLIAALAALLLARCPKPTDSVTTPPAVYAITYDGNGATSGTVPIDNREYREGETLTVKGNTGNLAQDNKDFAGWAAEQGAAESQYDEGDELTISESLTLYAVWEGHPFTINFKKNDAGGSQASLADQTWGASVTLPAATIFTPPEGMRFAGWAETPGGAVIQGAYTGPASYSPTVTLYAVWEDNPYTISFDKNHAGAEGNQASLADQTWGASIRLPASTTFTPPAGMRFTGWAETSDGAVIQGAYTGPGSYSAAVTLYAVWEGNPYAINFHENHAEARGVRPILFNQIWGASITLPATTFTPPPGMRFTGWAETPDGAVIEGTYTGPGTYSPIVTLYAVWGDNSYAINFDKNHAGAGGVQTGLADQTWGASITLPASTTFTSPEDMDFMGWAETPTGAVIQGAYTGPGSYSAAVTLYAVWGTGSKNWRSIASSSDGTKLAAVARGGGIYTSDDSGAAWTRRTAAGSRKWYSIASSSDGTKLAAVAWGGGIWTSDDSGAAWTDRSEASGSRKWYSIASSSDGRKLAAVVWGGGIWTSDDSGAAWTHRTAAGSRNWHSIASSSDGRKLAAGAWGGGIWTSDDSGLTWRDRSLTGSRGDWYFIASSSDGRKLAVAVQTAVVQGRGIWTSDDSGAAWTRRTAAGSRNWYSIASSSDGTKLAAVARGGGIYTSDDSGAAWTHRTAAGNRKWHSIASSGNGRKLAAVAWGGSIYTSDDSGATWRNSSR